MDELPDWLSTSLNLYQPFSYLFVLFVSLHPRIHPDVELKQTWVHPKPSTKIIVSYQHWLAGRERGGGYMRMFMG